MKMPRLSKRVTAAALGLCFWSVAAMAQDAQSAAVRSGTETAVGYVGTVYLETCLSGGLQARVTRPPSQGSARLEVRNLPISANYINCQGRTAPVQVAVYRSRPGFRGLDSFVVSYPVHNGLVDVMRDVTFTITVQ